MEGKKKYVALILFLLIGLTLFAFANPAEEEKDLKEGNGNQTEEITKDTDNDTTGEILEVLEDTTTLVLQNVDYSYERALAAVEAAEKSLLAGDVTIAKDLIDDVLNENQQNELLERIDIVEESMTAVALVEKL